mgnify:CR=1 FL=1
MHPVRRLDDNVVKSVRHSVQVPFEGDVGNEAARLAAAFQVRGFVPATEKAEDGTVYLFAERGRYSRFGVYVVHAALLMILGGGIMGRIWGAEGVINVFQSGGTFNFAFFKSGTGAPTRPTCPTWCA